jgi:hypothetical protein
MVSFAIRLKTAAGASVEFCKSYSQPLTSLLCRSKLRAIFTTNEENRLALQACASDRLHLESTLFPTSN